MLVSTSVPNLVNGVSQQAESLRYPSQCDEQINALSSVVDGLSKRPPTKHVAELNFPLGPFYTDPINRSVSERFSLMLGSGALKVFNLQGQEVPILNKDGGAISSSDLEYLQSSTPETSLKALTVADYTILLNREKTVAMSTEVTEPRLPEAMVFVKQLKRGATYTVRLWTDPTTSEPAYQIELPNVETDVNIAPIQTVDGNGNVVYLNTFRAADQGAVAIQLAHLANEQGVDDDFAIEVQDALVYFRSLNGADFRIEIDCTIPEGLFAFKDSVQSFSLLPKKARKDFTILVKGDPEEAGDDYYVTYVPQDPRADGICEGIWEESQKLGLKDKLDQNTLPVALINHGTHFVLEKLDWAARPAGDADTNPEPSFVGNKVRDVFFFKNRLAFLTEENVVLSESGEFFNFWRTTVIQLLDSDPIDTGTTHTRVSLLNHAVTTNEECVVFAENTQFLLKSGELLTAKTVSTPVASEYPNIPTVPPKAAGRVVFFPFKRGDYSGFSEYAISDDTSKWEADDITEHVPNYISGQVKRFDASDLEKIVVCSTDTAPDTLYVYKYFKQKRDRLQSAWSKWTFSGTIRGFFIIEARLYLTIERDSRLFLEYLELTPGLVDSGLDYVIHLDRRITESSATFTYDDTTDRTNIAFPYAPMPGLGRVLTQTGTAAVVRAQSGNVVTVDGDWRNKSLYLGENYTMSYDMSKPQMRERLPNGGSVVIPSGRFQVGKGYVAFDSTLYFRVEVTARSRPTYVYPYTPRVLGTDTTITGVGVPSQNGLKSFAVYSKNDQVQIRIINDTPLPCRLLSVEWEGLYTVRAQRT